MTDFFPEHDSADAVSVDFDGVLRIFAAYIHSDIGLARLRNIAFLTAPAELQHQQRLVGESIVFAASGQTFRFGDVRDPRPSLARVAVEGLALESRELLDLLAFVQRASELRGMILAAAAAHQLPELADLALAIPEFRELLRAFAGKLLPDGSIDDHASPELARIRRDIERQRHAIEATLQQQLRRLATDDVLQEELITLRGERFVLPVKAEMRRRVTGVVHGTSSTGQTVFIEPLETIEQNNELVRLLEEEQEEIRRILAQLTAYLRERASDLAIAAERFGELEFQLAKGRFAREYGGTSVEFVTAGVPVFELTNARHPVLIATLRDKGRQVVPLSLTLSERRVLVISGPNTGGKTVALKTAGVAVCMGQCGLPVCAQAVRLPIFDQVLADIGDAQSMRESLSTFSSHVVNIRRILEVATAASLVLLDELGAATDPAEGSALAIAVAEKLIERGAFALVSTHHGGLKMFASTDPRVLNASVGFDVQTLQPTYEFRVGLPGLSAGLDMAQQLGLQRGIVDSARARLSESELQAGRFLQHLERQTHELEQLEQQLQCERAELKAKQQRLETEERNERRRKLKELEGRFEEVLRQSEVKLRDAVQALQDKAASSKLQRDVDRKTAQLRRDAHSAFQQEIVQHLGGVPAERPLQAPANVKPGDQVRLRSVERPGRVLTRDGDRLEIEVGNLKMRVRIGDLLEVLPSTPTPARSAGIRIRTQPVEGSALREINLIGENSDEALRRLEKFLDNAVLAELPQVRIVHGTGMGVLRKAVAEALKEHPSVERFFHPSQAEGGNGVTIAEMRT